MRQRRLDAPYGLGRQLAFGKGEHGREIVFAEPLFQILDGGVVLADTGRGAVATRALVRSVLRHSAERERAKIPVM